MVRIDKVVTHNGDKGYTSVIGKKRLLKNSVRIEAIGSIDELLSWAGLIRSELNLHKNNNKLIKIISQIQNDLFDLGSELAFIDQKKSPLPITDKHINFLDQQILEYNKSLPALRSFVLPGSSKLNAYFHICRTVCRRAERRLVDLASKEKISSLMQIYLNRLGDLIFVLSRYTAIKNRDKEILWENRKHKRETGAKPSKTT